MVSKSRARKQAPAGAPAGADGRGAEGADARRSYMLIEMDRPPLPKRGLTTLLLVEPKEKFSPTETE